MPTARHNAYLTALTDMFYPRRCVSCERRSTDVLCRDCHDGLPFIGEPSCARCGYPTAFETFVCAECENSDFGFDSASASLRYEGVARSLVRTLKYRGDSGMVERVIAPLMSWEVRGGKFDVAVPVPMHRSRLRKRGYNQAELLCVAVAGRLGVEVAGVLRVTRSVGDQIGMTAAQRAKNVRGAFEATRDVEGRVLLVDDVFTTGATMSECAEALRSSGASDVHALSLCRTC